MMNEPKAIKLCLIHHDPAGFEYLFRKYRRQAFRHAAGWLTNADDAMDACQEAFSRAFSGIVRLQKLERFYPWFYVILRNLCMDVLNTRQQERMTDQEITPEQYSQERSEQSETADTTEREYMNDRIQALLQTLKPEFREILILKYFEDLSYSEIGSILSIPRGTVMSRLYHARKSFHRLYTQEQEKLNNEGSTHERL